MTKMLGQLVYNLRLSSGEESNQGLRRSGRLAAEKKRITAAKATAISGHTALHRASISVSLEQWTSLESRDRTSSPVQQSVKASQENRPSPPSSVVKTQAVTTALPKSSSLELENSRSVSDVPQSWSEGATPTDECPPHSSAGRGDFRSRSKPLKASPVITVKHSREGRASQRLSEGDEDLDLDSFSTDDGEQSDVFASVQQDGDALSQRSSTLTPSTSKVLASLHGSLPADSHLLVEDGRDADDMRSPSPSDEVGHSLAVDESEDGGCWLEFTTWWPFLSLISSYLLSQETNHVFSWFMEEIGKEKVEEGLLTTTCVLATCIVLFPLPYTALCFLLWTIHFLFLALSWCATHCRHNECGITFAIWNGWKFASIRWWVFLFK